MQLQGFLHNPRARSRVLGGLTLTGLLAASLLLGYLFGSGRRTLGLVVMVLPGLVIVTLLAFAYFRSFVMLLPITALAVPINISSGTGSPLPVALLLAVFLTGIWCISMFVRGWRLAPSPLNRPLLWFCAVMVLAFLWGRAWRDPILIDWNNRFIVVQVASLVTNLVSITACLLVGNFVTTVRQLKFLVATFFLFGTLMVVTKYYGIAQNFLNIMGLWSLWLVAPAYSFLVAQPKLGWHWRVLIVILLIITFDQVMIRDSLWLSGWIPPLTAIFLITLLRSWKAFVLLLVIGAIAGFFYAGFFRDVAEDNVAEGGLERLDIWEQNLGIVRDHWLLGTGPAGYASYYRTYFYKTARSTHNNYFDILAQFGVIGAISWLWVAFATTWEGWRLVRRAPPGFLRTLAIAATGGWVAAMGSMMLGDWILPFAYNQTIGGYKYTVYSWIFLGVLISLRGLLDKPNEPAKALAPEVP